MWNTKLFDFGNVKANQLVSCTFVYLGDKKMLSPRPDCGCTSTKNLNNTIHVQYTVPQIPGHLRIQGKDFIDTKTIKIPFTDGTSDLLTIKMTVVNDKNTKRSNDK